MIIEDGTYEMANQLAKENNPYAYVIRALRETLKSLFRHSKRGDTSCLINFFGLFTHIYVWQFYRWSYCSI